MTSTTTTTTTTPIQTIAEQWLSEDRDPETRATIQGLLDAGNTAELEKRLRARMAFGTAGLRSMMDAGYAYMNALTILQTSVGLGHYIKEKNTGKKPLVIVGYDGRRNSARFAHLATTVFLDLGLDVALFDRIVPTPFVPFAVTTYGAAAGVMVTASHNPPNDNGYKVYWDTGAQIISPHDTGIAASIERCLKEHPVKPDHWNIFGVEQRCAKGGGAAVYKEIYEKFFASMASVRLAPEDKADNAATLSGKQTPLVYTAMHGVGTKFTMEAMTTVAQMQNVHMVPEQCFPDPYFRTVDFPNPEEGKSALNLAIRTADEHGADIIIANDPDADRLAAAERTAADRNKWKIFTGNELGALLGSWQLELARKQGADIGKCAMLSSTVGSMILRTMAAHPKNKGLYFEETLTGFKFMGTRTKEIENPEEGSGKEKKQVIFAFEEAIGFMCGSRVRDKDGVTAAAVLCDLIATNKNADKKWTIQQSLDAVYAEYGLHVSHTSYVVSKDGNETAKMFAELQNGGEYRDTVGGSKVLSVRDLIPPGHDSTQADKKPVLPLSAGSPMVTMELENGVRFTVRASGTEPKIKYYTEYVAKPGSGESRAQVEGLLAKAEAAILAEIIKPEAHGFVLRKLC